MPNAGPPMRSLVRAMILAPLVVLVAYPTWNVQAQAPATAAAKSSEKPPRSELRRLARSRAKAPARPLEPGRNPPRGGHYPQGATTSANYRFVTVSLNEPAKSLVLHPKAGTPMTREAFLVLLDNATGTGYEAVVNLGTRTVARFDALGRASSRRSCSTSSTSARRRPGSRPAFRDGAEEARNRGHEPGHGRRLVGRALRQRAGRGQRKAARSRAELGPLRARWTTATPGPIEEVVTVIDLNRKEVVRVEDHGVVPLPPRAGNWARSSIANPRTDLKPLAGHRSPTGRASR